MIPFVQTALVIIRNLSITVMFFPLWLWSALYRYKFSEFGWLDVSWNVFSILALLYGRSAYGSLQSEL
jgi:hypothetical protein